ncbi:MAG: hypothetical protein AAFQ15_11430 [Pseudomonadota bacterium]
MTLERISIGILGAAFLANAAMAQTNAACVGIADHVQTVLENGAASDDSLDPSLQKFKDAQAAALDLKIQQAAEGYGLDADSMRAESAQELATMKEQLTARYGDDKLYQDYVVMLTNCVRASSEVEMGQTQAEFMNTINALRRIIG